MMEFPSQAAKDLAARLHGVEIGNEHKRITPEDKENGLVVVYGASDDLMEFRGAIDDEVGCYNGGTAYILDNKVLDESDFDCDCKWAQIAKKDARAKSRTVDALWGEPGGYSWTYQTDIPHTTFDVLEDGETYCRGIVFDLAATQTDQPANDITQRAVEWIVHGQVGISSKTIWSVMMGGARPESETGKTYYSHPRDPSDFHRCRTLLNFIPEWRARLPEVADRFPAWRGLVDHWSEMDALYDQESSQGRAPLLYKRITELTEVPY